MKKITKNLFRAVTKDGGARSSRHFLLKALKTLPQHADVRVVVSQKTVSSAVSRNRIKRRVRAIFKETHPSLQAIFFVKKGAARISFNDIRGEITFLLKKFKDVT